jgi:CDP-glucose 4,6-dehydratase
VGITRCGNLYGGGDLNWSRIVPGTIRSVLHGERPIIRSDGRFVRDYLYVADAADACLRLAEALSTQPAVLRGEAFNISNERPITVLDLVRLILARMDSDLEPDVRNQASHEIVAQFLCAEKARRVLSWRPAFTLEQGLDETIAWYRDFLAPASP